LAVDDQGTGEQGDRNRFVSSKNTHGMSY
jgi:hypothetical protein